MSNALQIATILCCKNSMLREGIKHILSSTRFKVHPEDWVQHREGSADPIADSSLLFLVDANLYPGGAVDAVQVLKSQYEGARVVVLADGFDLDNMLAALAAGADGYCLSTVGCEALVKYLDLVMLGEVVFPSAMCLAALSADSKVRNNMHGRPDGGTGEPVRTVAHVAEAVGAPIRILSSREAEILQCLMQGAPNKVIARRLEVAEATVKVHIKAILRKIRVANRTQAAMWAVAHLPTANSSEARL